VVLHGEALERLTDGTGAIYCATKHAVSAFNGSLLRELVNTPIRVCEIQPGKSVNLVDLAESNGTE
jgi:NADP-dependent 3-hydroxy acid dehydrogenase YdfG